MTGTHDEGLSHAVVVYIWGHSSKRQLPWPSAHPDAVEQQVDHAADLLPRVKALLNELDRDASQWFHPDLAMMFHRVENALRQRHPELTDDAVKALANWFAYNYK